MADLPDYEDDRAGSSDEQNLNNQLLEAAEVAADRARANAREAKILKNHRIQEGSASYKLDEVYRYFSELRGEGPDPRTSNEILNWFQLQPYPGNPPAQVIQPQRRVFFPSVNTRLNFRPRTEEEQAFLNHPPESLPGDKNHWRGTKFLGRGAYGQVGLFEYDDADDSDEQNFHKKIVVKEGLKDPLGQPWDLSQEDSIMDLLATTNSAHWVRRLAKSDEVPEDAQYEAYVHRIYLEYCSMHNLESLLSHRHSRGNLFPEASIWRLLECLVDGLTLLELGREYECVGANVIETHASRDWNAIVHFDIKPVNLLLERVESHPRTPIVKLADFGAAMTYTIDQLPVENHVQRMEGTRGYYLPEQWTKRWDYEDWSESAIAGQYTARSNIWQMGVVLYSMITNQARTPVDIQRRFRPQMPMFGQPSKGITFGHDLNTYIIIPGRIRPLDGYSETLIHTCWEMLYEMPSHRPSLLTLKQRIVSAKALFIELDDEPFEYFIVPEQEPDLPNAQRRAVPPQQPIPQNNRQPDQNENNSSARLRRSPPAENPMRRNVNSDSDYDDDDDDDGNNPDQGRGGVAITLSNLIRQGQQNSPQSIAAARSHLSQASSGLSSPPSNINTPPGFRSPASSVLSDPPDDMSTPSTFRSTNSSILSDPPSVIETPETFRGTSRNPRRNRQGQGQASDQETSVEESSSSSSESSSSESQSDSSSSSESNHSDFEPPAARGRPNRRQPPRGPSSGNAGGQNQKSGPSRGTRSQTQNQPSGFVSMAIGVAKWVWDGFKYTTSNSASKEKAIEPVDRKRKRGITGSDQPTKKSRSSKSRVKIA